jgi:magnesium transporter
MSKRSKKIGLPAGSLVHVGDETSDRVRITVLDYKNNKFEEKQVTKVEECFHYKRTPTVTWINVDGIHRVDLVEKLGKHFGLHPLLMEDIVTTDQRPKMEDFGNYLYIVAKMMYYNDKNEVNSEQISFVIGKNFLLTFQESVGDIFEPVRNRIRTGKGKIRKFGPDYLAYALLDAIVDNYFLILENTGEEIELLEEEVLANPAKESVRDMHLLKRQMIFLSRAAWPLREVISKLAIGETKFIKPETRPYLRDIYDHIIEVIDSMEVYREIIGGMLEVYLNSINNRLNEVMKVLTIIATIFMPLTFFAGVYGMNFHYMPELSWKLGYLFFWIIILITTIIMVIYFKKKKWV